MKTRFLSILIIAALLLSLCGCRNGEGASLNFAVAVSPSSLDPQYAGTDAATFINNCFEGLVRLDENGKIINGVAESYTVSEDLLTYTFTLREDAEWYVAESFEDILGEDAFKAFDNRVTAHDFVFGFTRAVLPGSTSPNAGQMYIIKNAREVHSGTASLNMLGVRAADDRTLIITLEKAYPELLENLTMPVFMPCNEQFFNACAGRYGLNVKNVMCNGPFHLTAWDPESHITFVQSKNYSGESTVSPSSVKIYFNSDSGDVVSKIKNGVYDAAFLPYGHSIKQDNSFTVSEIQNAVAGFCFNPNDSSLSNDNIRTALACSVSRSNSAFSAVGLTKYNRLVAPCCTADGTALHSAQSNEPDLPEFDRVRAVELWKKGIEELGVSSINLTILCGDEFATAMKSQFQIWQNLFGIELSVTVETVSADVLENRLSSGNYSVAFAPVTATGSLASTFLTEIADKLNCNPEKYAPLLTALSDSADTATLRNACLAAEEQILSDGIFVPVFLVSSSFICTKDVESIAFDTAGNNVSFISAKRFG